MVSDVTLTSTQTHPKVSTFFFDLKLKLESLYQKLRLESWYHLLIRNRFTLHHFHSIHKFVSKHTWKKTINQKKTDINENHAHTWFKFYFSPATGLTWSKEPLTRVGGRRQEESESFKRSGKAWHQREICPSSSLRVSCACPGKGGRGRGCTVGPTYSVRGCGLISSWSHPGQPFLRWGGKTWAMISCWVWYWVSATKQWRSKGNKDGVGG